MKKTFLLLFTLFTLNNIYCQNELSYSIKLNSNFYYYFLNNEKYSVDFKNSFNYGSSLEFFKRINNRTKLGLGLNYSTKHFYYSVEPTIFNDNLTKQQYRIKYFKVSFLFTYRLINSDLLDISLLNGIVTNHILDYNINRFYTDKPTKESVNISAGQKMSLSYILGLEFTKQISSKLYVNLSPYFDYKFVLDYSEQRPDYSNLLDDRFSFGLKFGLEYLLTIDNSQ